MKIAFLTYEYSGNRIIGYSREWKYGSGRYAEAIISSLKQLNVDVEVFSVGTGIKTIGPPLFWIRNGLRSFEKFDVVHSNEAAGIFTRHPRRVEFFHHPHWHHPNIRNWTTTAFHLFSARNANVIVVPSFYTKSAIQSRLSGSVPIEVIHHGVDKQVFYQSGDIREKTRLELNIENQFVVISVGRLESHKRHIDIIKSLSGIPNIALILVGRGPLKTHLIEAAKKLNVQLLLFDYVTDNYLRALYNASDVYVHSSILEGFGLTILEAMSCGVPIIAVNTADIKHVVGTAGYVIDAQKAGLIKFYLNDLSTDDKKRRMLSQIALTKSASFDWIAAAKKQIKIYEKILNE